MVIDLELFNLYTSDFNEDNDTLKELVIGSATEIVENYIGYKLIPEEIIYKTPINGNYIYLNEYISEIESIEIDGVLVDNYSHYNNIIKFDDIYLHSNSVVIKYSSGFSVIPDTIRLSILQIATLKYLESGKNIGMTGIQNPNGVGNTFVNYTNYEKWLKPLSVFKVI